MEQIRQAEIFGVRPTRTWRQASTKYLKEANKATLREDARHLAQLDPFIGDLRLEAVHMGTLQPFIDARKRTLKGKTGDERKVIRARTINYALQTVRHILNLAASEWMDEFGMTWLAHAPKIKLLREDDKKEPFPLSWQEQACLFNELPSYLVKMALFAVNTGCRDQEICNLRWEWEIPIPELDTSIFIIPAYWVKNRADRLVVLNRVARAVVEEVREQHEVFVFTNSKGRPVSKMCREAWRAGRERAGLPHVRVHDLKHTFGRRLRAAGVSFEDRQDLLGHKSGRITTHYSQVELENLVIAANKVCGNDSRKTPALVILKKKNLALASFNQAR